MFKMVYMHALFMFRLLSVLIVFVFLIFSKNLSTSEEVPIMGQGRFRPLETYAQLWLYGFYHNQEIKKEHLPAIPSKDGNALSVLWHMHFNGHNKWDNAPIFRIHRADLKSALGLDMRSDYFSYNTLKTPLQLTPILNSSEKQEWLSLQDSIKLYLRMDGPVSKMESEYENHLQELRKAHTPPKTIAKTMESLYPFQSRLKEADHLLLLLPGRRKDDAWLSLKTLKLKIYQPETDSLEWAPNFTGYNDDRFNAIRKAYLALEKTIHEERKDLYTSAEALLRKELSLAYASIAGAPTREAFGKILYTPTVGQLRLESIYYKYPWIMLCIALYSIALALFCFGSNSFLMMLPAFLVHTMILLWRSYILQRAPVANIFETALYVPWIGVLLGFALRIKFKSVLPLAAGALGSVALLITIQTTKMNDSFENVQAVLDSQYWLIVHVLMVVGSYGAFLLSGILGHFYLGRRFLSHQETSMDQLTAQLVLQSMYAGVALLIPGTILGGVWAAESWGRFWDWDPKESWAFISSCVYLIVIHAFTFHRIGNVGLALGSIIGLMAITFTWYGVNYILGTGLHSYGFGTGGEAYFYLYLLAETLFLAASAFRIRKHPPLSKLSQ